MGFRLPFVAVWLLAAWLLAAASPHALGQEPFAMTEPVIDRTGTLTASEIADLRGRIAAIESRRGSQIAVLMVATTAPLSIEQYALAVAEATRLGRAGLDDGVLIVVAKDDRAVRIEVGYGLEGAIPDAIASRIIREYLGPRFRAGDYAGGLGEAIDAIGRLIDGEGLPPPLDSPAGDRSAPVVDLYLGIVLGSFVAAFLGALAIPRIARSPVAATLAALIAGVILGSLEALLAAAITAALFALVDGRGRLGGMVVRGGSWPGGWSGGGWTGGGWSSGGSSRMGGSFGGWSGGGGGFGGGGASGRW